MHHPAAGDRHELHSLRFTGFESDRRTRGNIQTFPIGLRTIEIERPIGFGEVVVAADLNRPVAPVRDLQRHHRKEPA